MGYRGRRSHEIVPVRECPIAAPLLLRAALAAGEILRDSKLAIKPTEISLFCSADEAQLLASIFVQNSAKHDFEQFADAWTEAIPAVAGIELVEEGRSGFEFQTIGSAGQLIDHLPRRRDRLSS